MAQSFARLAELFRAVGDEHRLRILCFLTSGKDACVTDMSKRLGVSVAVASYHLQALAAEGLLVPVRHGKRVCYAPSDATFLSELKTFLCTYE